MHLREQVSELCTPSRRNVRSDLARTGVQTRDIHSNRICSDPNMTRASCSSWQGLSVSLRQHIAVTYWPGGHTECEPPRQVSATQQALTGAPFDSSDARQAFQLPNGTRERSPFVSTKTVKQMPHEVTNNNNNNNISAITHIHAETRALHRQQQQRHHR